MSSAPDRFTSRRENLTFAVCLLLSIGGRLAPLQVQDSIASAIRSSILAPFLALQEQAELIRASRTNYGRVVAQRDSIFLIALMAQALEEENARLRELMALSSRLPVQHVSAEVLHQSGPTDGLTVVLSAGRKDGVEERAPVIALGGLVGVVRSVDAATSVAVMWAHPDFRVSAMTLDGSVFGIVAPHGAEGPNTMLLELRGVPYRDLVPPGTVLYTSGLGGTGGVYPRGVPIGTVIAVTEEREGWSRTYLARPAVHPAAASHVIILTGFALDLGDAFSGEAR